MKNVKPAMLFVGGWFDAEDLARPLKLFRTLEANGPAAPDTLVINPFSHSDWSQKDDKTLNNLNFTSKTAKFYHNQIKFPFFQYYLKNKGNKLKQSAENK